MIKKLMSRKRADKKTLPARITNDTVAEHREKVLAGGRKHKYPIQYTKSTLVRNALLIGLAALVIAAVVVYVRLYKSNDTSEVAYRVTRILPLPVASVDGHWVSYSKYLMYQRASIKSLEVTKHNISSDERTFKSKQALDNAIRLSYAEHIARDRNIAISPETVDQWFTRQQRGSGLSETSYRSVITEQFGWSMDEMKASIKDALLLKEVKFAVDETARQLAREVEERAKQTNSLKSVHEALGQKVRFIAEVAVPKHNSDGGLTEAAEKLAPNTIAGPLKLANGDGYYFIQLHTKDGNAVRYSYLVVPLTAFDTEFAGVRKDKTQQYIAL